jgi:meiosis-specific protein
MIRVNISISSVAGYLPSSTEDNNAAFAGITARPHGLQPSVPSLTPAQEAALRAQQVDIQMKDADDRNVVWKVDGDDDERDAEGEPDEGYVIAVDGTYIRVDPSVDPQVPIGIRNQNGSIDPMPVARIADTAKDLHGESAEHPMDVDSASVPEAQFGGISEEVPTRVSELVRLIDYVFFNAHSEFTCSRTCSQHLTTLISNKLNKYPPHKT